MGNHNSGRKPEALCRAGLHPMVGDNIRIVNRKNGKQERACKACAQKRSRDWWRNNRGKG